MLYLFGKTISQKKQVIYSFHKIFGIQLSQSIKICKKIGINPYILLKDLDQKKINKIIQYINKNIKIELELKKKIQENINNLLTIKSYRGIRHSLKLPIRGQRTHTNAKTVKKLTKRYL